MNPSKLLLNLSLFLALLLLSFASYAQQEATEVEQPAEVKSLNKIRTNLIGLGLEREQKIGKTTTFYAGAGIEGVFIYKYEFQIQQNSATNGNPIYTYNTVNRYTNFKVFPAINAGVRHYYNFERRIQKGKSTRNNSAGYVAFDVLGILPSHDTGIDYQINLGPMWGFQTNAGKRMNFELSIGPGLAITNEATEFQAIGKIGFSFLL